jgi:diadenosine tetraphosphate (Ap4A) HIT family hydrolase
MDCPFCKPGISAELCNEGAFAIFDSYPVSRGHMLIIPHTHVRSFFDTSTEEKKYLLDLLEKAKDFLENRFHPDGFNIGINIGVAAGQSIDHLHIHLIPRYDGDMAEPKGGVRGVIPGKQKY